MHSDLYIAQHANLRPVTEIAEQLGLGPDDIDIYGSPHVAKVRLDVLEKFKDRPDAFTDGVHPGAQGQAMLWERLQGSAAGDL